MIHKNPAISQAQQAASAALEREEGCRTLTRALSRGPATWRQLAEAGLDRAAVLTAVGDIVAIGDIRIRVGPLLIEIEPEGDQ